MAKRSFALILLVFVTTLVLAGEAVAASPPIQIGTIGTRLDANPSVAVDATGTGYIAWGESGSPDTIQYCVLPSGASACSHTGTLTPTQATVVDDVNVLIDGATVLIVADGYGGPFLTQDHILAWQSTDSGATFTAVIGGAPLGAVAGTDTGPLNALIMPGGSLGFAYQSPGVPYFADAALSSPTACTTACPYAQLQPTGGSDTLGNLGGQFAAQSGASPGVLGIYERGFSSGPLSCNSDGANDGLDFIYGSGNQAPSNSYNIAPGTADTAWQTPISLADCNVFDPALASGASGLGVVETNRTTHTLVYHKFDQATESFDTTPAPIWSTGTSLPDATSVSEDASSGVYTTFTTGTQVLFAYSANGGSTWTGPAAIDPNLTAEHLQSAVGPAGQGVATWTVTGGAIDAQQFTSADAVPPATTLTTTQSNGTTTGSSITVPAGTDTETDRATLTGVNASLATGSVQYNLYSSSTCSASSLVFNGGSGSVRGGVVAASESVFPALPAGTYYWTATYTGDLANAPSSSACGSEVLTVLPAAGPTGPTGPTTGPTGPTGPTHPTTGPTGSTGPTSPEKVAPTADPVTKTLGGATITIYKLVALTGVAVREIPISLQTTRTRTFVIQLLSGTPGGKRKPLAHLTVTIKKAKKPVVEELKLPASIVPGRYTLQITVFKKKHHKPIGRPFRQPVTLS